jgi:branched-chain amino acid transport system substrate-binding protein
MPNTRSNITLASIALTLLAGGIIAPVPAWSAAPPHFDARARTTRYAGPGRELAEPEKVDQVTIGYFGPHRPGCFDRDLWLAAQLAMTDVNADGGYRGIPFQLVPAWSKNPWGTGVGQVAKMVYATRVWAIIGGPDGPSTHLAEQVVAKARLVLLSPGSTDTTAHRANVPWMFSCLPGDHLLAPPLADHLAGVVGKGPFAVVSADDHDSRQLVTELARCFTARRMAPRFEYVFNPNEVDMHPLAGQLIRGKPEAIVLVADPDASGRLVRTLRECGYDNLILGGPAMGRRQFIEQAGQIAGNVVFPMMWEPSPQAAEFAVRFRDEYDITADHAAAASYDAVRLLATAVGKAGLNRARIGDAIRELSPYQGIAGPIRWDRLGGNSRSVPLGTIRQGRVQPLLYTSSDPTRACPRGE